MMGSSSLCNGASFERGCPPYALLDKNAGRVADADAPNPLRVASIDLLRGTFDARPMTSTSSSGAVSVLSADGRSRLMARAGTLAKHIKE